MNSIWTRLVDQAFCVRLTESLLLFLSEGAAIGVAAFLVARSLRNGSAQARYVVHTTSLAFMALCLPLTFALMPAPEAGRFAAPVVPAVAATDAPSSPAAIPIAIAAAPVIVSEPAARESGLSPAAPAPHAVPSDLANSAPLLEAAPAASTAVADQPSPLDRALEATAPYAVFGYFAGVVFMFARLVMAFYGSHRLRASATPIRDRQVIVKIRRQAHRLGLKVVPVVAYCERIAIPVVIGAVKPMILLPALVATGLAPDQLQAILAHEMAHIRRFDLTINVLQRVIETVLFFHPAVWYVSRRIDFERENCCDDMVVRAGHTTLKYADALVRMAELSAPRLRPQAKARLTTLAVDGNNGTQLKRRVLRLLGCEGQFRLSRSDSFTLVMASVLVLSTLAGLWHSMSSDVEAAVAAAPKDADADKKDEAASKELRYAGTVVDEAGKPIEGAKVSLVYWRGGEDGQQIDDLAVTRKDGTFEATKRRSDFKGSSEKAWHTATCLVIKPGFGLGESFSMNFETTGQIAAALTEEARQYAESRGRLSGNRLTLPADMPIRGRIVTTEGTPVVGALVETFSADEGQSGSLDQWEAATKKPGANFYSIRREVRDLFGGDFPQRPFPGILPAVETDADGWFTLTGLGRERLANVVVSAPGIESTVLKVRSRKGVPIKLSNSDRGDEGKFDTWYPAEFTHVAGPSQRIEGTITDRKTGKPIAGAFVQSGRQGSTWVSGNIGLIQTRTDEAGHYELDGFPLGENEFSVTPPDGSSWLGAVLTVRTKLEMESLQKHVELTPGVLVRGTITDSATGKRIPGSASYFAFRDNPALKEARDFYAVPVRSDGQFEIAVLPGPGLVTFNAEDHETYPRGEGADNIKQKPNDRMAMYDTSPMSVIKFNYHGLIPVEPAEASEPVDVQLKLHPTESFKGRVVNAGGQAVERYALFGERAPASSWYDHPTASFHVKGYRSAYGCRLMAFDRESDSIGLLDVAGKAPESVEIRLQPAARFTGRLVDEDGSPIAGMQIRSAVEPIDSPIPARDEYWAGKFDPERAHFAAIQSQLILTDAQGKFEIVGVMPGLKYNGRAYGMAGTGNRKYLSELGAVFTDVVAKGPGVQDLGDVKVQPRKPRMNSNTADGSGKDGESKSAVAVERGAEAQARARLSGRVTDSDGKRVPGAKLSLLGQVDRGRRSSLVNIGRADDKGDFSIELTPEQRQLVDDIWTMSQILAIAPGYGPDALPVAAFESQPTPSERLDRTRQEVDRALGEGRFSGRTLKLPRQTLPIQGRLVDLEGKPLAGVRVIVHQVHDLASFDVLTEAREKKSQTPIHRSYSSRHISGRYFSGEALRGLYSPVLTDAGGGFKLEGIGEGQVASLTFEGERVDAEIIHVLSRDMAPITVPQIDSLLGGAKVTYYGAQFTHVLGPAVPITGVVKDSRSGTPIANAKVQVERLFRETNLNSGNLRLNVHHMQTTSDAQGRYRLWGVPPGNRHVLNVTPPTSEPWLMASQEFSISPEQREAVVDISVFKGIWLEGKVTDRETGEPIVGHVDYLALRDNPNIPQRFGLEDAWEFDRFPIDKDGHYRTAGLPGPGVLMVRNGGRGMYPRAVGASDVKGYDPKRNYLPTTPTGMPLSNWELIRPVDPPVGAETFTFDMSLSAGQTVPGLVTTKDGQPVQKLEVAGQVVNDPFWSPSSDQSFKVRGYDGTGPRRVFFRSKDLTLVGQLELKGPAPEKLTATMEPAVRVRGRLIETETGDVAEGFHLGCESSSLGEFRIEDDVTTSKTGDFEIRGLLAGATYQIYSANRNRFISRKNDFRIDLTNAKPGDVLDLGEVTGKNAKVAMPKSTTAAMVNESTINPVAPQSQVLRYSGAVVDEAGRPIPDAAISLLYLRRSGSTLGSVITSTDSMGRFDFSRRLTDFSDGVSDRSPQWAELIATKSGYGFQLTPSSRCETSGQLEKLMTQQELRIREADSPGSTNTLVLPPDHPVRGRIVNLEGQPVAGATIEPITIWGGKSKRLDEWEVETRRAAATLETCRAGLDHLVTGTYIDKPRATAVGAVQTDSDGWFTLAGLGRERIAEVILTGPGIEFSLFNLRSRDGETIRVARSENSSDVDVFYSSEFTHVAGPSRSVEGVVTDLETGKPLVGLTVRPDQISSRNFSGDHLYKYLNRTTDSEGKFRLDGLPLGRSELLITTPSGSSYLPSTVRVETALASPSVTASVGLKKGRLVRGKVTDQATGQPIAGRVEYFCDLGNANLKSVRGYAGLSMRFLHFTDDKGNYEIPVLPGKGLVTFTASDWEKYPLLTQDALPQDRIASLKAPYFYSPRNFHSHREIDPEDRPDELNYDFQLEAGRSVSLRVVDASGQAIRNALILGTTDQAHWRRFLLAGDSIEIQWRNQPCRFSAFDPKSGFAGYVDLAGDLRGEIVLPLTTKAARATGRVVDSDGLPIAGARISSTASPSDKFDGGYKSSIGCLIVHDGDRPLTTDAQGRFEIVGLIPDLRYGARVFSPGGRGSKRNDSGTLLLDEQTFVAGEVRELGDVTMDSGKRESSTSSTGQNVSHAVSQLKSEEFSESIVVNGVVRLPNGQPAKGATVRSAIALWAMMEPYVGENYIPPMSEAIADSEGRFSIAVSKKPYGDVSKLDATWRDLWKRSVIAASMDGFGPQWISYADTKPGEPITLTLVEDQPIRGQVIDPEGRPIRDLTIKVSGPGAAPNEDLGPWLEGIRSGELPWTVYKKADRSVEPRLIGLRKEVTTGDDGRFEITGVGKDRYLSLGFKGESVAHRNVQIVTRKMAPLKRLILDSGQHWEPVFGAEFTYTADPARVIEGIVKDAASGQPLAGVSIESYKLTTNPFSNNRVLKTVSDAEGKFRLIGMPKGKGNRLLAVPNDDQPYFMSEVDVPDPIGLGPAQFDVELHRGIWITGKVTNAKTGEGVAGVRLHYLPYLSNEFVRTIPEFDRGNVDGDQMRYVTRADGTYRLPGLPGLAVVGAESVLTSFRPGQGFAELDAAGYQKKGDRAETYRNPVTPSATWPTAMKEIRPNADAQSVTLDFTLDPGSTVRLSLLDGDGKPVSGANVVGLTQMGYGNADVASERDVVNLDSAKKRTLVIHHQSRKLGRVVQIGAEEIAAGKVEVKLEPTGIIRGRLLKDDSPLQGLAVTLRLRSEDSFGRELPEIATDADGRFEAVVPTGSPYSISFRGAGVESYASLPDAVEIQPGETKDLGTLTLGTNQKFMSVPTALLETKGK